MRRPGVGRFLAVFGLIGAALVLYVYLASQRQFDRVHPIDPSAIRVAAAELVPSIERGRHLADSITMCFFCHGYKLEGREIADDPWIGRIDSANLTRGKGGLPDDWSRADWLRALRLGLRRDGRSLLLMPTAHLAQMADSDFVSLIAYLEQVPPVDRKAAPIRIGWLSRAVVALGEAPELFAAVPIDRLGGAPAEPPPDSEPNLALGRYLVDLGSCRVCHHADLSGGLHPLALPGELVPPDLRPGGDLDGWSLADFDRAMRAGVRPDGSRVDRDAMPWPAFSGMNAHEIESIWIYLTRH